MTHRIGYSLLVSLILCLVAGNASGTDTARFVLIAGTNRAPESDMRPLQYADDDAVQYFELFRRTAEQIVLLTVMDAETQQRFADTIEYTRPLTRANFTDALLQLYASIETANRDGKETELYFIYSGHGRLLPGAEGAVTLDDGELTRQDLYELLLEKSPAAYNHLVIDACDAYYLVHPKGESDQWRDDRSGRQREEVRAFFDAQDLSRFPNTGVLLSTGSEAETHEWSLYRGGVFSHEVRSGLMGAADVTDDGFVEYSELQAFIRAANYRIEDPRARLDVAAEPPRQDARRPLIDIPALRETRLVQLPKSMRGHFYVEDDKGVRLADFNKSGEQVLTLAVPEGRTVFFRDPDESVEFEVAATAPARIRLDSAQRRPLDAAAKGAVETSFRANLFGQPYGEGFYAGFVDGRGKVPAALGAREGWAVPDGPPISVSVSPMRLDVKKGWQRTAAWTSAALCLGAAAGGGVLTYFAADAANEYRSALVRDDALLQRQRAFTYSAAGMYAMSALTMGLSIYWFVASRDDNSSEGHSLRTGAVTFGAAGNANGKSFFLGASGRF